MAFCLSKVKHALSVCIQYLVSSLRDRITHQNKDAAEAARICEALTAQGQLLGQQRDQLNQMITTIQELSAHLPPPPQRDGSLVTTLFYRMG